MSPARPIKILRCYLFHWFPLALNLMRVCEPLGAAPGHVEEPPWGRKLSCSEEQRRA